MRDESIDRVIGVIFTVVGTVLLIFLVVKVLMERGDLEGTLL